MWWPFKKKEKEPEAAPEAKFAIGDRVYFKHRGDRTIGHIYRAYKGEDGGVVYDVQVGGQCPYFLYAMKEDLLNLQN